MILFYPNFFCLMQMLDNLVFLIVFMVFIKMTIALMDFFLLMLL